MAELLVFTIRNEGTTALQFTDESVRLETVHGSTLRHPFQRVLILANTKFQSILQAHECI